jgi:hypothetical protein
MIGANNIFLQLVLYAIKHQVSFYKYPALNKFNFTLLTFLVQVIRFFIKWLPRFQKKMSQMKSLDPKY